MQNGRQRYRCKHCNKAWQNQPQPQRLEARIWYDYAVKDHKITQLCEDYQLGKDKLRGIINRHVTPPIVPSAGRHDVLCMDSTYFGRRGIDEWGLLIIVDAHTGEGLYCEEIPGHETYAHYIAALNYLRDNYGIIPKACVIDGVIGLADVLQNKGVLVQYCQFHQVKTILSYITRNPILLPNIELKQLAIAIKHMDKQTFAASFNVWYSKHKLWLKERIRNPDTGKLEYSHQKTRSAVNSIRRNYQYLFTYKEYPDLRIPNTNNLMEGINSAIKNKLNHHRGAKKALKTQLVRVFLSRRTGV